MKREIETLVERLVGEPMLGSARAASMEMFSFGERTVRPDPSGRPRTSGRYALHVQCAWRLAKAGQVIVGSGDLGSPADEDDERPDSNGSTAGDDRRDRRLGDLFSAGPFVVQSVTADDLGGLLIGFEGGLSLELFPDHSLPPELHGEYWRFFDRTTAEPHLVVTNAGITSGD